MATDQQLESALIKADKAGNVEDARIIAKEIKRRRSLKNTPEINNLAEGVRTLAKGATFGFADEIEAKIRSNQSLQDQASRSNAYKNARNQLQQLQANRFQGNPVSNEQGQQLAQTISNENQQLAQQQNARYKSVRDDLRAKNQEFARQNPNSALLLEMAGGIATPVLGTAKALSLGAKVGRGAMQGAGFGALYGAGNAEEMEDVTGNVAIQGALGGLAGGLVSGVGSALAPKLQKGAKELMDDGIQLTPGQAIGGGLDKLEQRAGTVMPGVK